MPGLSFLNAWMLAGLAALVEVPSPAGLKAALPHLKFRATLINRAIYWAVGSGIVTCLLMIMAFGSAYVGVRHEPAAAILFTLSLCLFTTALILFAREVRVAVNDLEFRCGMCRSDCLRTRQPV